MHRSILPVPVLTERNKLWPPLQVRSSALELHCSLPIICLSTSSALRFPISNRNCFTSYYILLVAFSAFAIALRIGLLPTALAIHVDNASDPLIIRSLLTLTRLCVLAAQPQTRRAQPSSSRSSSPTAAVVSQSAFSFMFGPRFSSTHSPRAALLLNTLAAAAGGQHSHSARRLLLLRHSGNAPAPIPTNKSH
jgi:hypothetical protein